MRREAMCRARHHNSHNAYPSSFVATVSLGRPPVLRLIHQPAKSRVLPVLDLSSKSPDAAGKRILVAKKLF